MAIFNSYVKLPEGIISWSDHGATLFFSISSDLRKSTAEFWTISVSVPKHPQWVAFRFRRPSHIDTLAATSPASVPVNRGHPPAQSSWRVADHEKSCDVSYDVPGLVNVYITNWKITMLLMGKSTISMAIFNSYVTNYQRVSFILMQTYIYGILKKSYVERISDICGLYMYDFYILLHCFSSALPVMYLHSDSSQQKTTSLKWWKKRCCKIWRLYHIYIYIYIYIYI